MPIFLGGLCGDLAGPLLRDVPLFFLIFAAICQEQLKGPRPSTITAVSANTGTTYNVSIKETGFLGAH
jgi:hypothetical protein